MDVNKEKKSLAAAVGGIDERALDECARAIIDANKSGKKVLFAGNGGSAADAQHFAAELVCTFENRARRGLAGYALTTNSSILTAWSNDFSFDGVFERQVEALGTRGDVLVSITTSGKSNNILLAMKKAKEKGMRNILFTGKGGGDAAALADVCINIKSASTPRIQESHVFAIHIVCAMIDGEFKDEK